MRDMTVAQTYRVDAIDSESRGEVCLERASAAIENPRDLSRNPRPVSGPRCVAQTDKQTAPVYARNTIRRGHHCGQLLQL